MQLDLKKLKYNIILLLVFGIAISGLIFFSKSLGMYVATGESEMNVDLAFSLLQTDELERDIELDEIQPDSKEHTYTFSVANYKEDQLIDVNMEYTLKVIATTNLPITYELYDLDGNKIKSTAEYIKDEHDTVFYTITSDSYKMNYSNKKIDMFQLKYSLDSKYDSSDYQDIIELLTVKIEAKQV